MGKGKLTSFRLVEVLSFYPPLFAGDSAAPRGKRRALSRLVLVKAALQAKTLGS
jgi:hypothetical protein